MPQPSRSILTVLLVALVLAPVTLPAQGTPYADPQHRFTLRVPDGWTARDQGDQGLELSGNGLLLRIIPMADAASPPEAIATLVSDSSPLFIHGEGFHEFDRREITTLGQRTSWILFEGTDPSGKPGAIRVEGIQGGGVTMGVVISGERASYYAQRGTIEAILGTLRLGTNPPIVLPATPPAALAPVAPPAAGPPVAASGQPGIGLVVREISDDDVEERGLDNDDGVLVDQVLQGGPADRAGIRPGDVILQLDRTEVDQPATLERMLGGHQVGDSVGLLLLRGGRKRPVSVRLEAQP